ncbi:metalloendopeptidase, partial [Oleoguttula sp. CCFEE 5521]
SLLADTHRLLERARKVQDDVVAAVTDKTATLANTLLPLIREENAQLYERQQIEFYAAVSIDAAVREASQKASSLFDDFDTDTAARQDVYDLLIAVRDSGEVLDAESQRWLTKSISSFERNGLSLSADERASLKRINADLTKLELEYIDRCDDAAELWCTREELDGLDASLLDEMGAGAGAHEGKIRVLLDSNLVHSMQQRVHNSHTRWRVYEAAANTCHANVPLLRQVAALRLEKAKLLGHDSYGSLRMAGRMDSDPVKMQRFIENIVDRLAPVKDTLVSTCRKMKHDDLESRHEEDDGKFYSWDRPYYSERLLSHKYALDSKTVSEYFALDETVTRMLGIFEHVMSLTFQELRKSDSGNSASDGNGDVIIWQDEVQVFAVWDTSSSSSAGSNFLGWLYMDMHPREGKRSGFSDQPVCPAYTNIDGTRKYAATALVCNFDKPTKQKPCLLNHGEVVLLFHELGHAMHDLVSQTQYARFSGASCGDFNEAPSQMLEEWCWYPETLRKLSRHYSNLSPEYMQTWQADVDAGRSKATTGQPDTLPEDLSNALVRSKQAKSIVRTLGLANVSLFELALTSASSSEAVEALDTTLLWHETACKTFSFDMPSKLVPAQANQPMWFTVDGLYVYLASQVYSSDMFATVFKQDPMSKEAGLRYRRTVLENGSSVDEGELLESLLGRAPNTDALFESIRIR